MGVLRPTLDLSRELGDLGAQANVHETMVVLYKSKAFNGAGPSQNSTVMTTPCGTSPHAHDVITGLASRSSAREARRTAGPGFC